MIAAIFRAQRLRMRFSTRGRAATGSAGVAIAGADAGGTLEHLEWL